MAVDGIHCVISLALSGLLVASQPADGPQSGPPSLHGVQTGGRALADLVLEARERSSTFRNLWREVDGSDWIVFLQTGTCQASGVVGCLLHRIGTSRVALTSALLLATNLARTMK